ncbi:uncharacterized protein TA18915 [Theileria annulata]|uniref:ISP3 C-terminal domain-containing protein n=1 Tax=Theileria annulata TaxID=5874 RepID=Q4UG65_THEAN|nr:uncharacterized protein TA18915 [Theileria annulata]CAI73924.1 hypothetical protein TA18915 [Theileria annulata]|eukprot:XP_954601.1 hypothetical protein TA18915 [Theileria annulata]
MSVKTSFNNFFGLFNSCCASGNNTKQEAFDEDLDGNTFIIVLRLVKQNFKEKLRDYLDVIVLLEVLFFWDGTKLSCTLHVNCETSLVRIACDKQVTLHIYPIIT